MLKKNLNQKTTQMKALEKRFSFVKDENPDADDVTNAMNNLQEVKRNLEDSVKKREESLNLVVAQNKILREEMRHLSESIQRLNNNLSVDCQISRAGHEGLKTIADIAEVFLKVFFKVVLEKYYCDILYL